MRERLKADIKRYYPAAIALLIYNVIARKIFHAFCPFLIATGFPCAGCGMTRAAFFILTGRMQRGMRLNPAAPMWILFILWFLGIRYLKGHAPKCANLILAAIALITLGIYVYRMAYFFPGSPPLVFYRNNLISRVLTRSFLN